MGNTPLCIQLRDHRLPAERPEDIRSLKRRLAGGQEWIQDEVNINNERQRERLPLFVAAMVMSLQSSVSLKVWHNDRYHILVAEDQVSLSVWDNSGTIDESLTPISSL